MGGRGEVGLAIRKLRKKLRQIENLERLDRDLSEEECVKIAKKHAVRSQLQDLIATIPEEENVELNYSMDPTDHNTMDAEDAGPELYEYEDDDQADDEEDEGDGEEGEGEGEQEEGYSWNIHAEDKEGENNPDERPSVQNKEDLEDTINNLSAEKAKNTSPVKPTPREPDQQIQSSKHAEKVKDKKKKPLKEKQQAWKSSQFQVLDLEGHNDLVCCLAAEGDTLVSGSRDTMVKVWDLTSGEQQRSLGGHTGSVTAVAILNEKLSAKVLDWHDAHGREGQVVISGSSDCTIRIWALETGQTVKSIYTYSPVTQLALLADTNFLVSGSSGGKIELWSLETAESVESLRAHDEAVTGLQTAGRHIYSASADGVLKVFHLREQDDLHLIYESENIKMKSGAPLPCRPVHCLATASDMAYYGDDGMNVKALDWRSGIAHKLANHTTEFGATDAVCVHDNLLLSSGYDIDNGIGYVNVRGLPDEKYFCSLRDGDTSRITCLACSANRTGQKVIVTGGMELKAWTQVHHGTGRRGDGDADLQDATYTRQYDRVPHNSDVESEGEWSIEEDSESSDSEEEGDGSERGAKRQRLSEEDDGTSKGWMSWCNLL